MGRIRDRQQALRRAKHEAQRSIADDTGHLHMMTAALMEQQYRDRLAAEWGGSHTVLAFLFAMPDESTIEMLNRRGDYFDIRSGSTWDLFFPGYYRAADRGLESHVANTRPVGDRYASDWYFNSSDSDLLRQHVEDATGGHWSYSGGSDLVLVNVYVPERSEPTIDWASTQSGAIRPPDTLAGVIERITRDLQRGTEDPAYGVASITRPQTGEGASSADATARDFMVQALAGVAAALGLKALGT